MEDIQSQIKDTKERIESLKKYNEGLEEKLKKIKINKIMNYLLIGLGIPIGLGTMVGGMMLLCLINFVITVPGFLIVVPVSLAGPVACSVIEKALDNIKIIKSNEVSIGLKKVTFEFGLIELNELVEELETASKQETNYIDGIDENINESNTIVNELVEYENKPDYEENLDSLKVIIDVSTKRKTRLKKRGHTYGRAN